MKRELQHKLLEKTLEVQRNFSNPERAKNFNREEFIRENIIILSETTATCCYRKDNGKLALAFFYYVNTGVGFWNYFFPADSHILGMQSFGIYKQKAEGNNFCVEVIEVGR